MKYLLILIVTFFSCCQLFAIENEKIYSFHSNIEIQSDGSVLVTEQIEVLALRLNINKGIYRDIPLNFQVPEGKLRQKLSVKRVLRNGESEPYHTEMIKGGVRIYIGRSDKNISQGKHTYELTYKLDRTVYCKESDCEVMWNVNGNQWNMTIDTLSATISTPENTSILKADGWTGRYGESTKKDFTTKSLASGNLVFMTNKIYSGSNLTISVIFDKKVMSEVSFISKMTYLFRDNSILILAIIGFSITFIINLFLWIKYGKDPKKGTIIPQYYAPKDWTPAEALYLLNEGKEDDNMFAAQLLQLAVKGHIRIEKKDSKSGEDIFVISYSDKTSKKQSLTMLEEGFLSKLLGSKSYTIIRERYNPRVSIANNFLINQIEKKQAGVYFKKNKNLLSLQYLFPLITLITMVMSYNYHEGPVWIIPLAIVLMIIMNMVFMRLLYRPTKKGRKMLDHILGLERFIKYADELRIKATNKPDMNFDFFERNLPYAVAFGKADEWGKKFRSQDIETQYRSSNYYVRGYSFHHLAYIGALTAVSASATVAPSSAGSSGGGFSGGGFSGGGAGGGGGGGW